RAFVGQECIHLLRRRGQPGQVEARPSNERWLVRLGRRLQSFLFESREDEIIHLMARPLLVLDCWQWWAFRFDKRPVTLPHRPLGDPTAYQINLRRSQFLAALRWR